MSSRSDDRVVSTLLAQPKESFRARFKKNTEHADFKIAVGDTISVLIWESAAGGLFSEASPASRSTTTTEPLAPEIERRIGPRASERNLLREAPRIGANVEASGRSRLHPRPASRGRWCDQHPLCRPDPGGRRSPAEVQQTIEERLAQKALEPQALVIVKKSAANSVTVTGRSWGGGSSYDSAGSYSGRRSGGRCGGPAFARRRQGSRSRVWFWLQGSRCHPEAIGCWKSLPPRVVPKPRLTKLLSGFRAIGVTATIPFEQLVADPAENIYARPGDVLTLVQVPQTFSVFGATGRNARSPSMPKRSR